MANCSMETAIEEWEHSVKLNPGSSVAWRNLSLAYYNKRRDRDAAKEAMEKARSLAPRDARIFLEAD